MAADLSSIGPVYVWPMNGALDQYVAEQATSTGVFGVTVDPARAKTVMTDHIDAKFFEGMSEVFVDEAAVAAAAAAKAKAKEDGDDADDDDAATGSIESGLAANRPANRPRSSPKGTVFLVNIQTREVIWSTFLGDFDRSPKKLHRKAAQVIGSLTKSMSGQ